ncbi:hypothetical protein HF669_02540 [Acidithiobacillus thiooxidans]|uniref:type IV pilus assembly protein FimV n=1 Tax=Acidithiobacillus thiooxidans TaxID=930 RepID=UPI0002624DA3|nr:hypothetical protein [Acidithiobacillus thiooxidans]MBU2810275.1 hypothetical protein [Acidithiobacillus thiooxidans]
MQILMLFLEVLIVLLVLVEGFIRLRRHLQARKKRPPAVSSGPKTAMHSAHTSTRDAQASLPESPLPTSNGRDQVVQETLDMQDLLREADIYLTYGHYAQAATVLRWYVDVHPGDTAVINKLLDTYTAMADINSYAELLEQLGEKPHTAPMEASWWRQRIQEGLQQDPGNLELLVLAEKVGMTVPIPREEQTDDTPIMTAKMALALVSRNPDPQYGMAILWRAITQNPLHLALYAEWLRITRQQHLLDAYINGLILLFLAVGPGGQTLRARVLRAGKDMGAHPLWETLSAWTGDPASLQALAQSRHLEIPPLLLKNNMPHSSL